MNVLVTGGCGFIGSNFINYFKNKIPDCFIITVDKLDYCSNKDGIFYDELIIGSITDGDLITSILNNLSANTKYFLNVILLTIK